MKLAPLPPLSSLLPLYQYTGKGGWKGHYWHVFVDVMLCPQYCLPVAVLGLVPSPIPYTKNPPPKKNLNQSWSPYWGHYVVFQSLFLYCKKTCIDSQSSFCLGSSIVSQFLYWGQPLSFYFFCIWDQSSNRRGKREAGGVVWNKMRTGFMNRQVQ